jgi:hypothetical protein
MTAKKQTVFKSLINRLYKDFFNKEDEENYLELEKQQMRAAWSASYENMRKTFGNSNYTPIDFEEYYNENYN